MKRSKHFIMVNGLKLNFVGKGKRQQLNGVQYAVYDVVMLVEGVHNGSAGPAFYPAEVIAASVPEWDGMPLPLYHPQDDQGNYIRCNEPKTAGEWSIGFIDNTRWEDGKLKAEAWVDITRANEKRPGLVDQLDSGMPMDVSTGLDALEDGVSGTWNNEHFETSLTEIFPDHLALLPDQQGACSNHDGCGMHRNEKSVALFVNAMKDNKINKQALHEGFLHINELSYEDRMEQIRSYVDSLDVIQNDEFVTINILQAVYDDYFVYSQRNKDGRKLYKQDYSVDGNDQLEINGDKVEVRMDVKYPTINKAKELNKMDRTNKKKDGCCPETVQALIDNESSGFTEDDRDWLLQQNQDKIDKFMAQTEEKGPTEEKKPEPKVNAEDDDLTKQAEDFMKSAPDHVKRVWNWGAKKLEQEKTDLTGKILACPNNKFTEDQLNGMEMDQLEGIAALIPAEEKPEPTANSNFYGMSSGLDIDNSEEQEEAYIAPTLFAGKKAANA